MKGSAVEGLVQVALTQIQANVAKKNWCCIFHIISLCLIPYELKARKPLTLPNKLGFKSCTRSFFCSSKQHSNTTSKPEDAESQNTTCAYRLHAIPASLPRDFVRKEPLRCWLRKKAAGVLSQTKRNTSQGVVSEQTDQVEKASAGEPCRPQ